MSEGCFPLRYGEVIDELVVSEFENASLELQERFHADTLPEAAKDLRAVVGLIDYDDTHGRYYILIHESGGETRRRRVCQAEIEAYTLDIVELLYPT